MKGHLARKKGSTRWYAVLHLTDPLTHRESTRWIATGTAKKREAQEVLTRLLAEQQESGTLPASRSQSETVAQFLTRWLTSHTHRVREATAEQYGLLIRTRLVPGLGAWKLVDLRPDVLDAHFQKELAAPRLDGKPGTISPRTVALEFAILRRALRDAERWGLISRNPIRLVDPPRVPRHQAQPLTEQQATALLAASRGTRDYPLILLALATGMRVGEILGLSWTDVDLETGQIMVQHTLHYRRGQPQLGPTKTGKGRRIAVGPEVVSALRAHRREQLKCRLALGSGWTDSGLVFTTAIGTPVNPANLSRRVFKPLLSKAGLPTTVRIHDLRHSSATILLARNVHPRVVQERLGHSTIGVTMDTYSHVLPSLQESAAVDIETALVASDPPSDGATRK